jgi:hypothetical protein
VLSGRGPFFIERNVIYEHFTFLFKKILETFGLGPIFSCGKPNIFPA